ELGNVGRGLLRLLVPAREHRLDVVERQQAAADEQAVDVVDGKVHTLILRRSAVPGYLASRMALSCFRERRGVSPPVGCSVLFTLIVSLVYPRMVPLPSACALPRVQLPDLAAAQPLRLTFLRAPRRIQQCLPRPAPEHDDEP